MRNQSFLYGSKERKAKTTVRINNESCSNLKHILLHFIITLINIVHKIAYNLAFQRLLLYFLI